MAPGLYIWKYICFPRDQGNLRKILGAGSSTKSIHDFSGVMGLNYCVPKAMVSTLLFAFFGSYHSGLYKNDSCL